MVWVFQLNKPWMLALVCCSSLVWSWGSCHPVWGRGFFWAQSRCDDAIIRIQLQVMSGRHGRVAAKSKGTLHQPACTISVLIPWHMGSACVHQFPPWMETLLSHKSSFWSLDPWQKKGQGKTTCWKVNFRSLNFLRFSFKILCFFFCCWGGISL